MHPIEHLRYVARSGSADTAALLREAAYGFGSFDFDSAGMLVACRRIIQRHPHCGPLWWFCSHLLIADDPSTAAWNLIDEFEADPTAKLLAAKMPDGATVLVIGWPDVGGQALFRRGDIRVLVADSQHEASSFMQRLERFDVPCEPIPNEALARASEHADLVLIDALLVSRTQVVSQIGSAVVAAVARACGTDVWLAAGLGRRLPERYVDAAALAGGDVDPWHGTTDVFDIALVDQVATPVGVGDRTESLNTTDCSALPELLLGAR